MVTPQWYPDANTICLLDPKGTPLRSTMRCSTNGRLLATVSKVRSVHARFLARDGAYLFTAIIDLDHCVNRWRDGDDFDDGSRMRLVVSERERILARGSPVEEAFSNILIMMPGPFCLPEPKGTPPGQPRDA